MCELVGLYLLHIMTTGKNPLFNVTNVGLYRDDCLAVIKGSARTMEIEVRKIFKKEKLDIVVEPSAHVNNFLDVELNLITGKFNPYRKPNDRPVYINAKSNHPNTIIKHLPGMIEYRISSLCSDKEIFDNEIGPYQKALYDSGYKSKLKYVTTNLTPKKKSRSRKITYFNPPFSKSVKTKVGKLFLELLDHHFPKNDILHKYFNRNTIKVSYCTLSNVKDHIAKYNAKVLNSKKEAADERKCNCSRKFKGKCPLQGNCLQESVIYQAHVTANNKTMTYTGMTKNSFKSRFTTHNGQMEKRPPKEKVTTLSEYVWRLKDKNIPLSVSWSIKTKAYAFSSGSKNCDLCLSEKMTILLDDPRFSLNQRDELLAKCPHKKYYCLQEYCESSTVS